MKDMKRALRRYHKECLKKKRSNYYGRDDMDERELGMVSNTPKICSEACCGNPRKWFGELTVQERKHLN